MATLSEVERSKIRRYLGYPNWSSLALSWGQPFPTHIEPEFYVNDALDRLSDEGLELVRNDLRQLEDIESQIIRARKRLQATKVGEISLNIDEIPSLRGEMEHWKRQLADDFGSLLNPFRRSLGGTRNGTVIG